MAGADVVVLETEIGDISVEIMSTNGGPCSHHDSVAAYLMSGEVPDEKLKDLLNTPGAAIRYFRSEGFRQIREGELADAIDGFRIVPPPEHVVLNKQKLLSELNKQKLLSEQHGQDTSTRKRKAAGCFALLPVTEKNRDPDDEKDALLDRVGQLMSEVSFLRKRIADLEAGCAAGYAREQQLAHELDRHGIPVPDRRRRRTS